MCSIGVYLNIAKGEILPGQTHMESTLFLQVMEEAKVVTDGNENMLQIGELMQVDGQENLQVINIGNNVKVSCVQKTTIDMMAKAKSSYAPSISSGFISPPNVNFSKNPFNKI